VLVPVAAHAEIGLTSRGICNPAASSPLILGRMTMLSKHSRQSEVRIRRHSRIAIATHAVFFSISGLLGRFSNVKLRMSTNKITLISARAKR
jgi:hypothetical protein